MNFLKETIDDIKDSGHSPDDIIFIGSEKSGHSCTWDDFCKLADNDYYNGFGGQSVAVDLIIVFSDGSTMWRGEYDKRNGNEVACDLEFMDDIMAILWEHGLLRCSDGQ